MRGEVKITRDATYDVWIQGGVDPTGANRNLALLGNISEDKIYLNFETGYTGGTVIGGNVGIGGTTNSVIL